MSVPCTTRVGALMSGGICHASCRLLAARWRRWACAGIPGSPRVRYGPGFAAGRPGVYINSSKARRAAPGPVRTNDLRTSSVRSTACGPPGDVHPSTRARTRSGCRAASCWVTRPPMDVPYTSARPMERASSTAIMSRANSPVL